MVEIHNISINPPLINSSCLWASDLAQLQELYDFPHTGAVTTRTATLSGFIENDSHRVVFTATTPLSTLNSYGYSPYPLSTYLSWIEQILTAPTSANRNKPFIISITSPSPSELAAMISMIQALRTKLSPGLIAIELNTSCPNIPSAPPPAYTFPALHPLLKVLASAYTEDPTLTLGLKLPPYVYPAQMRDVVRNVEALSFVPAAGGARANALAFLTCTNTLGGALLFPEQTRAPASASATELVGGLGGPLLHPLALGNVQAFTRLLSESPDVAVQRIVVVGVGGVDSPEAVGRMRKAGAGVVGCATALGAEGIQVFERLMEGL